MYFQPHKTKLLTHRYTKIKLSAVLRIRIRILFFTSDVDPDPDPAYHVDEDPKPTFLCDADPDPSFQIKAQNLEEGLKEAHILYVHFYLSSAN
jgi:hypothetical protein